MTGKGAAAVVLQGCELVSRAPCSELRAERWDYVPNLYERCSRNVKSPSLAQHVGFCLRKR